MKLNKILLVIIKKAELSHLFIPLLTICCLIVLALVYLFYNPRPSVVATSGENVAYVAVIFDDAGMDQQEAQKLLEINVPFDVAIIPFLPFSNKIALMCQEKNKEVLLHISMEPENGDATWLAPRSIMLSTPDSEIEKTFSQAIANIPFARGFNNHMGSLVCKDERIVKKLVELAKANNMFIVDSKTSPKSLFSKIGKQKDVRVFERDIFLDSKNEVKATKEQFKLLFNIAKKKGYAIGIGHLGPEGGITTIEAFKEVLNEFSKTNIRFVFVSDLQKIVNQK